MTYLIFSREPQEGELPILGKTGPQIIRFHLSHPEPEPGGRGVADPVIRVEIKVPVGESSAYGAFSLTVSEARSFGLLEYEPLPDEGFLHKKTGLKVKTLQMDTTLVIMVTPVEGKSYLSITEVGYDTPMRVKGWGRYSAKNEKPATGEAFAKLLARAKGTADEPVDDAQPAEPPAPAKRRRVAI